MKHFLIILTTLVMIACGGGNHESVHNHSSSKKYTCPMHPDVSQDTPGKCPVCGMDLVLAASAETSASDMDMMLTDSQIRLANITTQKIVLQPFEQHTVVNGRLVVDETRSRIVSSRAGGRIDKLYFKETGRVVRQGEPLYEIYSETMQTLQREYLLTLEQLEKLGSRYSTFVDAAYRKLILYGMTESQVNTIRQQKTIQNRLTIVSPTTGVIRNIDVSEGQYVDEGTSMMKIESIDKIWVEADIYPSDRPVITMGTRVIVKVTGFENDPIETKVDFLSPTVRNNSQIIVARATLNNLDMRFTPGTHAQVVAFTHSASEAIAIPVDAVIRDQHGTHVYLQKGLNNFRPQMIKTGRENFEKVEITEGLQPGDTVVASGAYLLYSEFILKKGIDPAMITNSKNK